MNKKKLKNWKWLVTQRGLDNAGRGSAGDAEEHKGEYETNLFDSSLFALLAMLFWSLMVRVLLDLVGVLSPVNH